MTKEQKSRLRRLSLFFALALLCAAALLFAFSKTGIGWRCPFNLITALRCPGCGSTRAAAALLHLRVRESLALNYAWPLEFLYVLYVFGCAAKRYVVQGRFSYLPSRPAVDYAVLALLLIWWVARNILKV